VVHPDRHIPIPCRPDPCSDCDTYGNTDRYGDCHTYSNGNAYCHTDGNRNGDTNSNSDGYTYANGNSDSHTNPHGNSDAQAYAHATATSNAGAAADSIGWLYHEASRVASGSTETVATYDYRSVIGSGERGRLARSFRRPAESSRCVSREGRDTANEAPALLREPRTTVAAGRRALLACRKARRPTLNAQKCQH